MAMTTIQIEKDTREDIKTFGYKDETYDEILNRLMRLAKMQMFFERQKRILETEEFVSLDKI
ncbi:MAG: hypothetical protein J4473_04225 [Candidatus Aenigmarchaeota archaeon]|nr:hypothetical protein [Candidatus Aenigmarchaeota archaeon]